MFSLNHLFLRDNPILRQKALSGISSDTKAKLNTYPLKNCCNSGLAFYLIPRHTTCTNLGRYNIMM